MHPTLSWLVRSYYICLAQLQKVVHIFLSIIKKHLTYPEVSVRTIKLTQRTLMAEMAEHQTFNLNKRTY